MRPIVTTLTADADSNGICLDQTTPGAANLLLNGTLVSAGVATMLSHNSRLSIESAANLSGVNFTITGADKDGRALAEVIVGPNANTVTTIGYFYTVTLISVDAAVGTNVEIGPSDQSAGAIIGVSRMQDPDMGIQNVVSSGATLNYTLQMTLDEFQDIERALTWFNSVDIANKTADYLSESGQTVRAYRMKLNSHATGSLTTTYIQNSWS